MGDGGGENEGTQGVHGLFEQDHADYVRRRCLPHISWRVSAAYLDASGDMYKSLESLNTYLRDGVTWKRLGVNLTHNIDDDNDDSRSPPPPPPPPPPVPPYAVPSFATSAKTDTHGVIEVAKGLMECGVWWVRFGRESNGNCPCRIC